MGQAVIDFTFKLLADWLHLPDGTVIEAVRQLDLGNSSQFPALRVLVRHPDLPDVSEGARRMLVRPTWEKVIDGTLGREVMTYWGELIPVSGEEAEYYRED